MTARPTLDHPDFGLDPATALLVGPLLGACLTGKLGVDEAFGNHVVDVLLRTRGASRHLRRSPPGRGLQAVPASTELRSSHGRR